MPTLLTAAEVANAIETLADAIARDLPRTAQSAIVGIRSRGEILARRLTQALAARGLGELAYGTLDITLYRDDLAEIGPAALVRQTEIAFDVADCWIVLVDDVLFTGRSARAAIEALVDLGRPRAIRLAVLVDRGGRELPIQADYIGVKSAAAGRQVTVLLSETDGRDAVEVA